MNSAADDFVNSLKSKILDSKIHEEFKKNILKDCVDYLVSVFKNTDLNLRSISQFESRDFCFLLDVLCSNNPHESIKNCLSLNEIKYKSKELTESKFAIWVDLENRLVSSGNPHNIFFIDVYSKKDNLYKLRISTLESPIKYYLLDKSYHEFSFWVFDDEFDAYKISLRGKDRNKKKQNIDTEDGKYQIHVHLNDIGEMIFFELNKKKRKKNKQ